MSTRSTVILGVSLTGAVGMIIYVHKKQTWERLRLREGVLKDLERQRIKQIQRREGTVELHSVNITVQCTKTLVLLENLELKESHNFFFQLLNDQEQDVTFMLADDPNLTLTKHGVHLFNNLIIFAPSVEEFGGSVTVSSLTNFVDSGGNIIVALNSNHPDGILREFAYECGLDIGDEGSPVIDHFNYDVLDKGNHTLLVVDPINLPHLFSLNTSPILYQGIGILPDRESALIIEVLSAAPTAYSHNPAKNISEYAHAVGKNIVLVAAIQARNNARITFSGSSDLFSNTFLRSAALRAQGNQTYIASGNKEFVTKLLEWTFQNIGVLRIGNIRHSRKNEISPPAAYTVNDNVVYSVEIDLLVNGEWLPYKADDLQLDVVRIDPFIRKSLKRQGDKYVAEIKLPDQYGIYQLKVDYNRKGYTHLFSTTQVSVRPKQHHQYERFIPGAYPYYLSAFSMMFGVFLFAFLFLYSNKSVKPKED